MESQPPPQADQTLPGTEPVGFAPGTLARYEIGEQVAAGGMGVVLQVRDRTIERPWP